MYVACIAVAGGNSPADATAYIHTYACHHCLVRIATGQTESGHHFSIPGADIDQSYFPWCGEQACSPARIHVSRLERGFLATNTDSPLTNHVGCGLKPLPHGIETRITQHRPPGCERVLDGITVDGQQRVECTVRHGLLCVLKQTVVVASFPLST